MIHLNVNGLMAFWRDTRVAGQLLFITTREEEEKEGEGERRRSRRAVA